MKILITFLLLLSTSNLFADDLKKQMFLNYLKKEQIKKLVQKENEEKQDLNGYGIEFSGNVTISEEEVLGNDKKETKKVYTVFNRACRKIILPEKAGLTELKKGDVIKYKIKGRSCEISDWISEKSRKK